MVNDKVNNGKIFLHLPPDGMEPRRFYSVDRCALYREMGFRTRTGFGDAKLPTVKRWRGWIKGLFDEKYMDESKYSRYTWINKQGMRYNFNQASWDYDSVDFGPLDLYNVRQEWINNPCFDKVREEVQEVWLKAKR